MRTPLRALLPLARLAHGAGLHTTPAYRRLAAWVKKLLLRADRGLPPHTLTELGSSRLRVPYGLTRDYLIKPFEPQTVDLVRSRLAQGQVFVDVGANIGVFTLLAAERVGPTGRVYAIEPGPDNLAFLTRNVADNHLDQVDILSVAAGSRRGRRRMHLQPLGVIHSFYVSESTSASTTLEVDELPLDDLVSGRVDLVKIDVEGAELEVLAGMEETLRNNPGLELIVEWNPAALARAGAAARDLPDRLAQLGLTLRLLDAPAGSPPLEEVQSLAASGHLASGWYANLHGRREL